MFRSNLHVYKTVYGHVSQHQQHHTFGKSIHAYMCHYLAVMTQPSLPCLLHMLAIPTFPSNAYTCTCTLYVDNFNSIINIYMYMYIHRIMQLKCTHMCIHCILTDLSSETFTCSLSPWASAGGGAGSLFSLASSRLGRGYSPKREGCRFSERLLRFSLSTSISSCSSSRSSNSVSDSAWSRL